MYIYKHLICFPQTVEEFYNIFGPELKSVTGDPKRIDEVRCRVDGLVLPIEEVTFNPFNISKMRSWKMVMRDFDTTVQVSLRRHVLKKYLHFGSKLVY